MDNEGRRTWDWLLLEEILDVIGFEVVNSFVGEGAIDDAYGTHKRKRTAGRRARVLAAPGGKRCADGA